MSPLAPGMVPGRVEIAREENVRSVYSPAAEQRQAGAQFKLGVMCDMSNTAEPPHLKVADSAMIPNADPATQAAALLKMALRAVLLSGQAPRRLHRPSKSRKRAGRPQSAQRRRQSHAGSHVWISGNEQTGVIFQVPGVAGPLGSPAQGNCRLLFGWMGQKSCLPHRRRDLRSLS